MSQALNQQLLIELFLTRLNTDSYIGYKKSMESLFKKILLDLTGIEYSKSEINKFRSELRKNIEPIFVKLYDDVVEESALIASIEASVISKLYGVDVDIESIRNVAKITKNTLIHGYRIGDSFAASEDAYVRRMTAIIADGMATGKNSKAIKTELNKTQDANLQHIRTTTIRSIVSTAREQAREVTNKAIDKELDGHWEFVATLDNRTCIAKGQRVNLSNGETKNIEDVSSGDEIITHTGKKAKVKYSEHTGFREVIKVTFSDGREVVGTEDHLIWDGEKWVKLGDITEIML